MVEYKDRLAWAMKRAGKTRTELAARLDMSYQGIRKALIGDTKSMTAQNNVTAAAFLGVSSRWLATGLGRFDDADGVTNTTNTVTVPLMNWQQIAAKGGNLESNGSTHGVACERVATYGTSRPSAFALGVINDVMVNPSNTDPSFPPGSIILIDPDDPAKPGDFVLASDPTSGEPTFKRLMLDGGRWFLKPLNPSYPTTEIQDPAKAVIGRVYEYQLRKTL